MLIGKHKGRREKKNYHGKWIKYLCSRCSKISKVWCRNFIKNTFKEELPVPLAQGNQLTCNEETLLVKKPSTLMIR